MKQLMSMLVLSVGALSLPATASTHREMPANAGTAASGPGMTKQQSKMGSCNAEAGDKKGDERKAFMKQCLSAKPVASTQQEKMKTCNKTAAGKKGDERKAYMKECLSA